MARSTSAARPAPVRVLAARPPAVIAIERLAKMSAQNASTHKIVGAARDIIAGWRAGGVQSSALKDEMEALVADLELGMEAAENYVSEAETDGQRKGAQAQFDALRATREVVIVEMAGA